MGLVHIGTKVGLLYPGSVGLGHNAAGTLLWTVAHLLPLPPTFPLLPRREFFFFFNQRTLTNLKQPVLFHVVYQISKRRAFS